MHTSHKTGVQENDPLLPGAHGVRGGECAQGLGPQKELGSDWCWYLSAVSLILILSV